MVLFGTKKESKIGKGEIPTEKVKTLLNRGFSEIEIIDLLRKDGYSPQEIDKALIQAVNEIKTMQLQPQQTSQMSQAIETSKSRLQQSQSSIQETKDTSQQVSSQQPQIQTLAQSQSTQIIEQKSEAQQPQIDYISLEEYIEYLLREKTQEINKRLMEINLRHKELEERILNLRNEIEDMSTKSKEDINKILNEIRITRDNINDLSIKVEALGKTLKELLPSLIESVKLLSEIIQKLKA